MSRDFEELFGEIVGTGKQATVYAKDDYAVKLYREGYPKANVFAEAFMMSNLEVVGFPSPRIHEVLFVEGRYGLRMDRVKGKIMSEDLSNPARWKGVVDALVDLQCSLQKNDAAGLPGLKDRFRNDLVHSDRLSADQRKTLLDLLEGLPDGQSLCHCDFHAENVFFDGSRYTIIDLLQMSRGDPAADAACSYAAYNILGYDEEVGEYYLRRYCEKSAVPLSRIQQWVRVYAGTVLAQLPEQYAPLLRRFIAGEFA